MRGFDHATRFLVPVSTVFARNARLTAWPPNPPPSPPAPGGRKTRCRLRVSLLTQARLISTKLKILGPLCDQTDKTYSFEKHNKDYKKHASLNNSRRNHTNGIFYENIFRSMDWSIDLWILRDACHELFCAFGDFYASVMQHAEITKSLLL